MSLWIADCVASDCYGARCDYTFRYACWQSAVSRLSHESDRTQHIESEDAGSRDRNLTSAGTGVSGCLLGEGAGAIKTMVAGL